MVVTNKDLRVFLVNDPDNPEFVTPCSIMAVYQMPDDSYRVSIKARLPHSVILWNTIDEYGYLDLDIAYSVCGLLDRYVQDEVVILFRDLALVERRFLKPLTSYEAEDAFPIDYQMMLRGDIDVLDRSFWHRGVAS